MNCRWYFCGLFLTFLFVRPAAADSTEKIEEQQLKYAVAKEAAEKDFATGVGNLKGNYKKALTALQVKLSGAGDLDGALAVKAELTRIDEDDSPVKAGSVSSQAALADLQKKYAGAYRQHLDKRYKALKAAAAAHVRSLEGLMKSLTVANDLEGAVAVRGEIEKFKNSDPLPPNPMPDKGGGANSGSGANGLPRGALVYFPFDKKEDDGRVLDSSGGDHHGESNMNSWEKDGKRGGGFRFVGGQERVKVEHQAALSLDSGLTIAAWVKLQQPSSHGRIVDKYNFFRKSGYAFTVDHYRPVFEMGDSERRRHSVKTDAALSVGEWNHVAVTFDAGDVVIYINGKAAKEETVGKKIGPNDDPLRVGLDELRPLNGSMDELVIYGRALSEAEINRLKSTTGG